MRTILLLLGAVIIVALSGCVNKDALRLQGCHDAMMESVKRQAGPLFPLIESSIEAKVNEACKDLLGLK